jgi:hypothetical protein
MEYLFVLSLVSLYLSVACGIKVLLYFISDFIMSLYKQKFILLLYLKY